MRARSLITSLVVAPVLLLAACATPGAPMPPSLQLPRPVEDLDYARKGQRVVLTWTEPTETTDRVHLKYPGAIWICRSIGVYPVNQCDVIKRMKPADLQTIANNRSEHVMFEDTLPDEAIRPGVFATYSVEVFNSRGRSAGMSNQVRVPMAPVLHAPSELKVTVDPNGPRIEWTSDAPEQWSSSGSQAFYRLMRKAEKARDFVPVQDIAPSASPLVVVHDPTFEWEQTYSYKVIPVTEVSTSAGATAEIEGDDSPVVSVNVHDVFPPPVPSGVQAVFSGTGQKPFIDLTWAPDITQDLAGYNIFRHELSAEPVKINDKPVVAPSFRDDNVQTGAKYFYSVSAVDLRGNESQRSAETSETVPK